MIQMILPRLRNEERVTLHLVASPDRDSRATFMLGSPLVPMQALLGLMALIVVVSGCVMVGPDFVTPEASTEGQWLGEDDPKITNESADYSEWWTVFDDPVLDSLIGMAFEQNLPLRIAGIRVLEARANLGIAVGNLYPQQQQASAAATANQLSQNATNTALVDKFNYNYSTGFDAAWELDFWGRFRRGNQLMPSSLLRLPIMMTLWSSSRLRLLEPMS